MLMSADERRLDQMFEPGHNIMCQYGAMNEDACPLRADKCITWRTPSMSAPAFYYVCEGHAMQWWASQ